MDVSNKPRNGNNLQARKEAVSPSEPPEGTNPYSLGKVPLAY
jgi:hypothetical protein